MGIKGELNPLQQKNASNAGCGVRVSPGIEDTLMCLCYKWARIIRSQEKEKNK